MGGNGGLILLRGPVAGKSQIYADVTARTDGRNKFKPWLTTEAPRSITFCIGDTIV